MHSFRASLVAFAAAAFVVSTPIARADMPRFIDFQGVARAAAGGPIAGPVDVQVTLYNAAAGGSVIFGPEAHPATPLNGGGLFQLQVGSKTVGGVPNAVFDHTSGVPAEVWMAVKIGTDPEMTPRIRLVAVPYAYRVDRVASPELDDAIALGSPITPGSMDIYPGASANPTIRMFGGGSRISTYASNGDERVRLWGPSWGEIFLYDQTDNNLTVSLSATSNSGGSLTLSDPAAGTRFLATAPANGGLLRLYDNAASPTTQAAIYGFSGGGRFESRDETGSATSLLGSSNVAGGFIELYQANGSLGMNVDGDATGANGGGVLNVYRAGVGSAGVTVDGYGAGTGGEITLRDTDGTATVVIQGAESSTNGGQILMRNAAGVNTITLDSDFGGDGRITTQELQITGGSDLSEQFDIAPAGSDLLPGMVVCIDPANPGDLVVSRSAYDRTVAGIVSGAVGVKPGMLMGQKGTAADGKHPVALTGRVYCLADASSGSIVPGDLLTSSSTPGHAMKVSNHGKAQGAIIGKAMTGLESGRGLVLVLVSLQ